MDGFMGFLCGSVISTVIWTVIVVTQIPGLKSSWNDEAVKQGHAEYYLDENNHRQWRWLPTENADAPAHRVDGD